MNTLTAAHVIHCNYNEEGAEGGALFAAIHSIYSIGIHTFYSVNPAAVDSSEWECKLNVNKHDIKNILQLTKNANFNCPSESRLRHCL